MAVRYITVTPITKMFKPATRAFGDIAIVGGADNDAQGPFRTPVAITNPDSVGFSLKTTLSAAINDTVTSIPVTSTAVFSAAPPPFNVRIDQEIMRITAVAANALTATRAQGGTTASAHVIGATVVHPTGEKPVDDLEWFKGDLGRSVRKAFEQTPGPTTVWAVRTDPAQGANAIPNALTEVAKLDVQIVTIANRGLGPAAANRAEIELLASHVSTVSRTGSDGKERIGVAMFAKDVTDPGIVTPNMSIDRMVMVAHKSDEDAAAAFAGTIAGYEPHISILLKQVKIGMDSLFSDAEIDAFNTARINWLTDPTLLPGKGLFAGEGYTLGADIPYIDICRTIDDISFRLKAALIRSIGDLRVSRSGLRALISQMTAILEPLRQREVIEAYEVFMPLLVLLDKPPATLTDAELQQINNAQNERTVQAIVSVDYAGAIHRLNITLKFV
ncbi:MAG TPA: hypothetical protein VJU84_11285 [Pyrinomonadaceae bacterium]|nr:hypothetical protein [Pyrinomonadaceae bacterium]